MTICVDYLFVEIGYLRTEEGKLKFPKSSQNPGVYRFMFDENIYIGETDQFQRRFQHYRTPGPSQSTNIRLNLLFLKTLDIGAQISLSVTETARISVNGIESLLDLKQKCSRQLIENAEVCKAQLEGRRVLNL